MQPGASATALRQALERVIASPLNYWLVLISDVVWALGFLVVGMSQRSGSPVAAGGAVLAGFLTWGLLEYALHRWLLHGAPSIAKTSHARHHGNAHALISAPLFVAIACALVVRALLALVLPPGVATLAVFGIYAGYDYFSLLHHVQHLDGSVLTRIPYWRRLGEVHDIHHHRAVVNFGVTTTFWDRVFGTFDPADLRHKRESRRH